jgi:peptidoglycan hydrolase CwlO-like protein
MAVINTVNIARTQKRADEADDDKTAQKAAERAEQQTGIMLALSNIEKQLTRIENEISTVRQDTRENHDNLLILEQSFKSEHKRLDAHEERINKLEERLAKRA